MTTGRFMEIVANDRGVHILVTTSTTEAATWLGVPIDPDELAS